MRTGLLADKLLERGHEVVWWASAFDHFQKQWRYSVDTEIQIGNRLSLKILKGIGYKRNISFSRLLDHRIIARKFRKFASSMPSPDVIIASFPPYDLAFEAVTYAQKNKIPVFVDIRDEWPDLFLNVFPESLRRPVKWLLWNEFRLTKHAIKNADGLFSMMETLLDWGLSYAERPRASYDGVFYLGAVDSMNRTGSALPFLNILQNKFVITFVGTFVKNNDPSIIIDCARKLSNKPVHFVLAGDGELRSSIMTKAVDLPNVTLPGWLTESQILTLLNHSHVGICPAPGHRNAFPNKAFSYLSAGLPVITGFLGDLKQLIHTHAIGIWYKPNDVDDLANSILSLVQDNARYQNMRRNVRQTYLELFDADKIYKQYAEHIENLVYERTANSGTSLT